jgi:hypothetical protein
MKKLSIIAILIATISFSALIQLPLPVHAQTPVITQLSSVPINPSIVSDPASPNYLFAGALTTNGGPCTSSQVEYGQVSSNYGKTWNWGGCATPIANNITISDQTSTISANGTIYTGNFLNINGETSTGIRWLKSTTHGTSWTNTSFAFAAGTPVSSSSGTTYYPCLLFSGNGADDDLAKIVSDKYSTSPYANNVYVLTELFMNTVSTQQSSCAYEQLAFIMSSNGGQSWTRAYTWYQGQLGGLGGQQSIAVLSDGTVVITGSTNSPNPPCTNGGISAVVSTNAGQTWSLVCVYNNPSSFSGASNTSPYTSQGIQIVTGGYPSAPSSGSADAVIFFQGCVNGSSCSYYGTSIFHLFSVSSTNSGSTWTSSVSRVDSVLSPDDTQFGNVTNAFRYTSASYSSTGRLDIAWVDLRNGGNSTFGNLYYANSTDNGSTYGTNIRITSSTYQYSEVGSQPSFDQVWATSSAPLFVWSGLGGGYTGEYFAEVIFDTIGTPNPPGLSYVKYKCETVQTGTTGNFTIKSDAIITETYNITITQPLFQGGSSLFLNSTSPVVINPGATALISFYGHYPTNIGTYYYTITITNSNLLNQSFSYPLTYQVYHYCPLLPTK